MHLQQVVDNSDWSLVPTYPQYFVVPQTITLTGLKDSLIPKRIDGRCPVATYRHSNGSVMLLASFLSPAAGASGPSLGTGQGLTIFGIDCSSMAVIVPINKDGSNSSAFVPLSFCTFEELSDILNLLLINIQKSFDTSVNAVSSTNGMLGEVNWLTEVARLLDGAVQVAEKMQLEDKHAFIASIDGRSEITVVSSFIINNDISMFFKQRSCSPSQQFGATLARSSLSDTGRLCSAG